MDFLWVCPVIMWPLALCPFCGSLVGRSETYRWLHFPSFWKPGEQKWVWQEAKDNERIWGSKEKFWGWGEKEGERKTEQKRKWESERSRILTISLASWNCDRRQPGTETDDDITHLWLFKYFLLGFPNLHAVLLWNTKDCFIFIQWKSVWSNVGSDLINFHCTDKNSFKTFFRVSSFVFHKKRKNTGLEQHESEWIMKFYFGWIIHSSQTMRTWD